jgi:hypothetical protein
MAHLEPGTRGANREVRASARHAMKIDPPGYESGPRRSVGVEPRFHSPTRLIHPGATNLLCAERTLASALRRFRFSAGEPQVANG